MPPPERAYRALTPSLVRRTISCVARASRCSRPMHSVPGLLQNACGPSKDISRSSKRWDVQEVRNRYRPAPYDRRVEARLLGGRLMQAMYSYCRSRSEAWLPPSFIHLSSALSSSLILFPKLDLTKKNRLRTVWGHAFRTSVRKHTYKRLVGIGFVTMSTILRHVFSK